MGYPMSKQKRAVLASIKELGNGRLSLCLDDLVSNPSDDGRWDYAGGITSKEYDQQVLEELSFSEKELADFGYYVIARLYAFYKRGET
jgi:hypothetical protein